MIDIQTSRECPVLPGYFFRRDGMFSVGTPDGPFFKGQPCKVSSGKIYRRILSIDGRLLYVHRLMGFTYCHNPLPEVFIVCDHINGQSDDNRACNLRWITQMLNVANNSARNAYEVNKTPITVRGRRIWIKSKKPYWWSRVTMEGKSHSLGWFATEQAACDCSRAFRAKKWKEIYLRILNEHEAGGAESPSFDLQPVKPPPSPPGPLLSDPVVQRPREGRAPRLCCVRDLLPEAATVSANKKKTALH